MMLTGDEPDSQLTEAELEARYSAQQEVSEADDSLKGADLDAPAELAAAAESPQAESEGEVTPEVAFGVEEGNSAQTQDPLPAEDGKTKKPA